MMLFLMVAVLAVNVVTASKLDVEDKVLDALGEIFDTVAMTINEKSARDEVEMFGKRETVAASQCLWKHGSYGVTLKCDPGYVAMGACGSGKNPDCGENIYTKLQCCPIGGGASDFCSTHSGQWGAQLRCPTGKVVTELCGSGKNPDCGDDYVKIECCALSHQTFKTDCLWEFEDFGKPLTCASGSVMTGACGSGANGDCPGGKGHGIQCCGPPRCLWKSGSFGETLTCDPGYVATGACGSGKNPDCGENFDENIYTKLQCCPIAGVAYDSCSTYSGMWGAQIQCSKGEVVKELCESGTNPDCGRPEDEEWVKIECCTISQKSLTSDCLWNFENFGQPTSCAPGSIMTGVCGSGHNNDCPGENAHGIRCCQAKCEDDEELDCNAKWKSMCKEALFRTFLEANCPVTCGIGCASR